MARGQLPKKDCKLALSSTSQTRPTSTNNTVSVLTSSDSLAFLVLVPRGLVRGARGGQYEDGAGCETGFESGMLSQASAIERKESFLPVLQR